MIKSQMRFFLYRVEYQPLNFPTYLEKQIKVFRTDDALPSTCWPLAVTYCINTWTSLYNLIGTING